MWRLLVLSPAVLVTATLAAVPVGPATAQEVTCEGRPATIVGTDEERLVGTPGDDVIVTGSVRFVDAGAGEDLVCVTTDAFTAVVGGDGDDRIVVTSTDYEGVNVNPGAGDDVVIGGPGPDAVSAFDDIGRPPSSIDGRDRYVLRGGPDTVLLGGDAGDDTAPDVVNTGTGDDTVVLLDGAHPGSEIAMGMGQDTLRYSPRARPALGTIRLDLPGGAIRHDARTVLAGWSGVDLYRLEQLFADDPDARFADVEIAGTPRRDSVIVDRVDRLTARLGTGDDRIAVPVQRGSLGGVVEGSSGRDLVVVNGRRSAQLDLGAGTLREQPGPDGAVVQLRGFEEAGLIRTLGDEPLLRGSERGDTLVRGCGVADGGAGDDILRAGSFDLFDTRPFEVRPMLRLSCSGGPGFVARGGPGDDVVVGSLGNDTLLGGPGRDRADGGPGNDRCVAEVRRNCER